MTTTQATFEADDLPVLPTPGSAHFSAHFAGWRRILWADLALLVLVRRLERRHATRLMRAFTRLGDTGTWVLLTFLLAAVPGTGPGLAVLMACGAVVALAVSQLLKRVCRRQRPCVGIGPHAVKALAEIPDAFSFPSGHTAVAFAVATALASPAHGLAEVAAVLACGIGVSRVYLGAHYPLDVLAGAGLGIACGWTARVLVAAPVAAALGLG